MKVSATFTKVFLSAPQLNPANSGVNYKRAYNKTRKNKGAEANED